MPYLSFDLDALDSLPDAARAARIEESAIALGLLRMWRWCWRAKKATVNRGQIRGFFGVGDDVAEALAAFGFLEAIDPDTFRVRGAERYLRINAAQSAGGRAKAANLKKGSRTGNPGTEPGRSSGLPPGLAPGYPEVTREATSGSPPALSANSEHLKASPAGAPARSKEEATAPKTATAPKAPGRPAVAREASTTLRDRMDAAWREKHGKAFVWRHADEAAVHPLLQLSAGDEEEIVRRWINAVSWEGFPTCGSVPDLVRHWNTYGTAKRPPTGRGRDSGDRDWSKPQKTVQTAFGEELSVGDE